VQKGRREGRGAARHSLMKSAFIFSGFFLVRV
jgi:hypothetical protein